MCIRDSCITVSALAIIPFSFSRKLLYPLWLPFNINNNFYYLAFAYEMYVCIYGVLLTTSVCILYVGLSTFYVTILHLIGETIECIDQLPETKLWHIEQHNKGILIQDTTEHVIKRAVRQHAVSYTHLDVYKRQELVQHIKDFDDRVTETFINLKER